MILYVIIYLIYLALQDSAIAKRKCISDDDCEHPQGCCRYAGNLPGQRPNICMTFCACPHRNSSRCYVGVPRNVDPDNPRQNPEKRK